MKMLTIKQRIEHVADLNSIKEIKDRCLYRLSYVIVVQNFSEMGVSIRDAMELEWYGDFANHGDAI